MRRSPVILGIVALALVWGCSSEQVTAPEGTVSEVGDSGQGMNNPGIVTLADLEAGMGAGEKLSGPDVAVTAFTASPSALLPGDLLTIQATVANLGSATAVGPFDVWIGVLNAGFEFARVTIDRLAPGEVRGGTVHFTLPIAKFATAYPPGTYTLYCTHNFGDSNPVNNYMLADVELTDTQTGAIQITVTPSGLNAPWTLTGAGGGTQSGSGSTLLTGLVPGDYTITWGDVAGYDTPTAETATLATGATLTFTGAYTSSGDQEALRMWFEYPDSFCTTAAFLDHVTAHIVYMNPSIPSTRGFECGYDVTLPGAKGAQINTNISVSFPVDVIDVGLDDPGAGTYNRIVGFNNPLATSSATVVATLDIFVLESDEIFITMRPAIPQSPPIDGNPKVVKEDFNLVSVPLGQAPGSPSLVINPAGPCPVISTK